MKTQGLSHTVDTLDLWASLDEVQNGTLIPHMEQHIFVPELSEGKTNFLEILANGTFSWHQDL